ncbi:MAG: ribonuclease R [Rhodospirillaceae bacterium]|nr:ribonuclease R [Rhodospirillaceae bacterium]
MNPTSRHPAPKRPKTKHAAPLPTPEQIKAFIRDSKGPVGKREIARAFGVRGGDKIALKALLKSMAVGGDVVKSHKRRFKRVEVLPSVDGIEITGTDSEGDLFAKPINWPYDAPPPVIVVIQKPGRGPAYGVGDRVLAKLRIAGDDAYEARPIKRLAAGVGRVLGVYEALADMGRLRPVDRRYRHEVFIAPEHRHGAAPGDLVAVEVIETPKYGPQKARVVETFGPMARAKNLSTIAIHTHDIPHVFSDEAEEQAQRSKAAPLGDRTDLRDIPLVTIDGEDARDFDDAVWAEPDTDPANADGWHLVVAIADVSWYVRPGDALDREAYQRGNSVYFPDRVVPMLPEALSNGWCSLKAREDRPCLAAHLWIDRHGKLLRHKFVRGLMRSVARLTYTQVQNAIDGRPNDLTAPLLEPILRPLYRAYAALTEARQARGTLELDLIERQIIMSGDGKISGVVPRPRYDSHKLIEEFMINANVAAAERLEASPYPCVYRVHDTPDPERVDGLREALATLDIPIPRSGAMRPADFNRALDKVRGGPHVHLVNTLVLRTQSQAVYSPHNVGHFGLALRRYAHFTSPIRRYSDLLVHRALIAAEKLGDGGWDPGRDPDLDEITEHISATERRAAAAERETVDRYTAGYLADKIDAVFRGRVNGVSRFGAFITLDDTGADGILPMRHLPQDFYDLDEKTHRLVGRRHGLVLRTGDVVHVRLLETDEVTGSILFDYVDSVSSSGSSGSPHRAQRPRHTSHRPSSKGPSRDHHRGRKRRR